MGRKPCCDKLAGLKRGPWTVEEDRKLSTFILHNGIQCWRLIPKLAGLMRCGKSCRLRWVNYLKPGLKREAISQEEEALIIHLQSRLGNRWSKIAAEFPGRTDNDIKNHWNKIKKKLDLHIVDPDQDQNHKMQPADENHQDHHDQEQIMADDHVECKSSEADKLAELSSTTPKRQAGSKEDHGISERENNGSDRSSASPSSSCAASTSNIDNNSTTSNSAKNNSTASSVTINKELDSTQALDANEELTVTPTPAIPQVHHQLEVDESFSENDWQHWLESAEPIVSWDEIRHNSTP